ncbi:hypothetical protein [Mesobacillus jeotgali]|uniref:hypothetical protein n=1 Tax=Mesobacillus jeotgali TaxID=129985 RepID=UPI001CFEAC18|nr:hypothetical protein [Mesobacillus jeotgali]
MKWIIEKTENDSHIVKQISYVVNPTAPSTYKLTWNWPKDFDYVYVHTSINEPKELESEKECNLASVYSKDEYKRSQGFQNAVDLGPGNKHIIQVYPVRASDDAMQIYVTPYREDLSVLINSKKAKIQAAVTEKRKFFSKRKKVTITLYSNEMDIDKRALCYVKKANSRPVDKTDGYYFPLLRTVRKGQKASFNITVSKNDLVNVFLSDTEVYGDLIQLEKQF